MRAFPVAGGLLISKLVRIRNNHLPPTFRLRPGLCARERTRLGA
jgi:hypothetical protein